MGKLRRILSAVMVLCLLLVTVPVTVRAYDLIGSDINYAFNAATGTLTFTGKGAMPDYNGSFNLAYQFYWMTYDRNLDVGAVKKLVFGEGITHIGRASFLNFVNLESVKFPSTLTSIGEYAFAQSGLTSVTLPENLEAIGAYAFMKCELTGIDLPDSLISIGMGAFKDTNLAQVVVPKGVTTVSSGMFSGCCELVSATFEGPIAGVGGNAFYNCAKLTSVTFKAGVSGEIGDSAFAYCDELEDCVLTEGVTRIGENAFCRCQALANVIIPEGVKYIDDAAFRECRALTAITIPESVISMGDGIFVFCDNLKTITMYSEAVEGANGAIGADNLDYVHIHGDAPSETDIYIFGRPSEQFVIYYDRGTSGWTPYTWGNYLIEAWGEPESVKTGICGENATWTLENGVMTVSGTGPVDGYGPGTSPWYNIKHTIKKLVIEDGITEIGQAAFFSLHRMTEVSIPDSVTSLGSNCFGLCQSLTEITIPAGVTKIGSGFAQDEMYIEAVYFQGDAPDIYGSGFNGASFTAYYPMGNETWTEDVLQDYGGAVIWEPYCPGHDYVSVTAEANCIQNGGTTYTCSICRDTYVEGFEYATGQHSYKDNEDTECDICGSIRDLNMPTTPMYRLYNPNSGEHFYTGSLEERENLITAGWQYEGIAWNAPTNSGDPVYRLYNPNSGDHHYTMSEEERDMLVGYGWQYEGVAWNSAPPSNLPLYRLYNPNADCGSHHYTGSAEERDFLVSLGWIYEGIGWFGMIR